jgi:sarcosine oxidase
VDAQVVVVGGGVMGLSAAWRLARRGVDVVLLEQFDIGHDRGSSHGPTRVFRFLYHDPVYVRMAQAALPMWRELEQASGKKLLRMTGGVHIDSPDIVEIDRGAMLACDAAVEVLAPDARRQRFPWIEAADEPAIFTPDMGLLDADGVLAVLRNLALEAGAEIRSATRVDGVVIPSNVEVIAGDETIRARCCVVAVGGWTAPLLAPIGIDVPLRVTREQVVFFESDDAVLPFVHGKGCWIYGVPSFEPGGELPGGELKVAGHGIGPEVSPDERSFDEDDTATEHVASYVRTHLPTTNPDPLGYDTCLYSTTPDADFVIDRRGPIVVVSPCSGHGFKFAPLIGDIAACLAVDEPPPVDIGRFGLARFSS